MSAHEILDWFGFERYFFPARIAMWQWWQSYAASGIPSTPDQSFEAVRRRTASSPNQENILNWRTAKHLRRPLHRVFHSWTEEPLISNLNLFHMMWTLSLWVSPRPRRAITRGSLFRSGGWCYHSFRSSAVLLKIRSIISNCIQRQRVRMEQSSVHRRRGIRSRWMGLRSIDACLHLTRKKISSQWKSAEFKLKWQESLSKNKSSIPPTGRSVSLKSV